MELRKWQSSATVLLSIAATGAACGARTGLDTGVDAQAHPDASDAGGEAGVPLLAVSDISVLYRSRSGTLFGWGGSPRGERNDAGADAALPNGYQGVAVPTPEVVATTEYPAQPSPMAGGACVLAPDGTVDCWASDVGEPLGDFSKLTLPPTPPGTLVVSGAVALSTTQSIQRQCARMKDGTMTCWGNWPVCDPGYLPGDGGSSYQTTPVERPDFAELSSLALAEWHVCGLKGATVYCCGNLNQHGQLGDGTTTAHTTLAPAKVQGDVVAVAVGVFDTTCAILMDTTVQCWGYNGDGQLGDGTSGVNRLTPVPVVGLAKAAKLALGWQHSCALLEDNTARCWGDNTHGAIGDGTTTQRLTPAVVVSPNGTGVLSNIVDLYAADNFTCALVASGDVYCWGSNEYGSLGDGTTNDRHLPTKVIGLPP